VSKVSIPNDAPFRLLGWDGETPLSLVEMGTLLRYPPPLEQLLLRRTVHEAAKEYRRALRLARKIVAAYNDMAAPQRAQLAAGPERLTLTETPHKLEQAGARR
jgi:hypothetical protein